MKKLFFSLLLLSAATFSSKAQAPYFKYDENGYKHTVIKVDSNINSKQSYLNIKNWLMSKRIVPLTDIENSRMFFSITYQTKSTFDRNGILTVKVYADITFKDGKYRIIVQPYQAISDLQGIGKRIVEEIMLDKLFTQYYDPEHRGYYKKSWRENAPLDIIRTCEDMINDIATGITSRDNF